MGDLKELVKGLTQSPEERAVARALKQFSKGQIDRSIATLREAHDRHPDNTPILYEMARLLAVTNHGFEAADAFRTILRRDPKALTRVTEVVEEIRARHPNVGPLYDAIAEHHVRQGELKVGSAILERMKPEDLRVILSRHLAKFEQHQKSAPAARLARIALCSAYHLALCHEAVREYEAAANVYRSVARTNPGEFERIIPRLQGLIAKDYHNAGLRVAVADLLLRSDREDEAAEQFGLAIASNPEAARPISQRLAAHLAEAGDRPGLRWTLVLAYRAIDEMHLAMEEIQTLLDQDFELAPIIEMLQPLATRNDTREKARRLLADASLRHGKPQQALETLLEIADDEGLPAARSGLEALAEAQPKMARVHHLLADIHTTERRPDQAIASLKTVFELTPGEGALLRQKVIRILESDPSLPDAQLFLADLLAGEGDTVRATIVLRHLIHEAPESSDPALSRLTAILDKGGDAVAPRARLGVAEACLGLKRWSEALEHLVVVTDSKPAMDAEFLHTIGILLEGEPELNRSLIEMLETLQPRASQPVAVRFLLADALLRGGDPVAAAAAYREVLRAAPERADEVRQAVERFDRDDNRAAEARHLLATIYLDRRDFDAVIAEVSRGDSVNPALLEPVLKKFEEIIAATPADGAARAGFIKALLLGGHHDRVIEFGQETLKLCGEEFHPGIHLAIGDALAEKEDSDGAIRRYFEAYRRDGALAAQVIDRVQRRITLEGTHPLGSLVLGKVLAKEAKIPAAVESMRTACSADTALRDAVLRELREIAVAFPGDPHPGLATVAILREAGDTSRALDAISTQLDAHPDLAADLAVHLEEILKVDPSQPLAHYELGRAMQRLKTYARSAGCYLSSANLDSSLAPLVLKRLQEINEAEPACADVGLATAAILVAQGKPLPAAETLWKALRRNPGQESRLLSKLEEIWLQNRDNGRVALFLAEACRAAGQDKKALLGYIDALDHEPTLHDTVLEGLDAITDACPKMGEVLLTRGRLHARHMKIDSALADLDRAVRRSPRLIPLVTAELEELRQRYPDSQPCAMLLADIYMSGSRKSDALILLREECERCTDPERRLSILFRLAQLSAGARDTEAAGRYLAEAERVAPDRARYLLRAHEVQLRMLRAESARLGEQIARGSRAPADIEQAVDVLVDLGETGEARTLLDALGESLDPPVRDRLRAGIALRQGDYSRAFEQMRSLGHSRRLAFGAARAGDFTRATETVEALMKNDSDPGLKISLQRLYRELTVAELLGGSRRLTAETTLTFKEREAS